MNMELNAPTSRRSALKIGGLTVSMAALAAACGEDRGQDPSLGRIGNAPVVSTPPSYDTDDIVLLRTASSLEFTAIEVYEAVLQLDGAIPDEVVPVVERLVGDHRIIADRMVALTEANGGEAWTCSNPWLMDRVIGPALELIQANVVGIVQEDTTMVQVIGEVVPIANVVTTVNGELTLISDTSGVAAGDEIEFERLEGAKSEDTMAFANALENLAAASHQELASATSIDDARVAHLDAAITESRHSAVLAIAILGAEGYISPALFGEDVPPTARGQIRHFAVESIFGQTGQTEIKAGPGDLNSVRKSVVLQTPAANSLIYNELSCDV
ncbi:MAG: hypothetical protein AB8G14_12480 [Ilumatobacter sp.]